MVRGYGVVDSVTITSFQKFRLEETRAHAPELPTGWLVSEANDSIVAQSKEMGLTQICPRANTLTPELVNRLHREGFVVRAWGVTDEALMRGAVDAGVDGMTVNFPDKLIEYLKAKGIE
ncbi:MAG: glycerophosphodiester phosphodiesterase [Chloroflexi bacterium]|nr:glycerophosphodiester phosphodiesterase [Chloroflexota bacterium]